MQRKAIAILIFQFLKIGTFPGGTVVKNLPAKAGDTRDACSIPGSGRSLEWEMATHSIILAWKIPWTEDPGGLQSMGHKKLDMTEYLTVSVSIFINNNLII